MARPRPTGRERLVIWGDGDIAIFETCQQSKKEGHLLFKFRPTPQMESNKNIDPSHYDEMDHLINRIYPKDMCIQLSYDPDFAVWIILCDYNLNEDTPLMGELKGLKRLIEINRDLAKQIKIKDAQLFRSRLDSKKRAENPEGYFHEVMTAARHASNATKSPTFYPPTNPPFDPNEET